MGFIETPSIQMLDLKGQYSSIKNEIETVLKEVLESTQFINGPQVKLFESELSEYLGGSSVIACGNGTDALQIALMSLGLQPGDEVIVPSFTYVSCAEVICLLNLTPVWADVNPSTFNMDVDSIEQLITPKTKAVIVVHLFGQCAHMEGILQLSEKYNFFVIEDAAQSLGAEYRFRSGAQKKAGTIGHVGCTSFFPSKILGCFGDGGALMTSDKELSSKIRMIANHGQREKYVHEIIGVNSRLDTMQAAILKIKLKYIDQYIENRRKAALLYRSSLNSLHWLEMPYLDNDSDHVYGQFTVKVSEGTDRNHLKHFLASHGIPSMIYYPIPLHKQTAFKNFMPRIPLKTCEDLSASVLSLPIHTEIKSNEIEYIAQILHSYSPGS